MRVIGNSNGIRKVKAFLSKSRNFTDQRGEIDCSRACFLKFMFSSALLFYAVVGTSKPGDDIVRVLPYYIRKLFPWVWDDIVVVAFHSRAVPAGME